MKTTPLISGLMVSSALFGVVGCGTLHQSDSATLQGKWKGEEVGASGAGPCYLMVSGSHFEFRGANPQEWYKGTFALRQDANPRQLAGTITDCPSAEYVGKVSQCIYRIEGGTLTMTGNEPGKAEVPSSFDAPQARQFVFKKEQAGP